MNTTPTVDGPDHAERLNEAILAYLDLRDAGTPPDRDEFLARYPSDLLSELEEFLDDEAMFRTPEAGRGTAAAGIPTPPPGEVGEELSAFRQYDDFVLLNRGGMGAVYRGRDRVLGRRVAIKVTRERYVGNRLAEVRFAGEARVTSRLQHPHIPPVYELGVMPDGRRYFAMKLVEGEELSDILKRRPSPSHDLERFLTMFRQVCEGVAYAHSRGVIHRDLKPANVMVGAFGEVQVMDWGLAKSPDDAPVNVDALEGSELDALLTQVGAMVGTRGYMPPEQAMGEVEKFGPASGQRSC